MERPFWYDDFLKSKPEGMDYVAYAVVKFLIERNETRDWFPQDRIPMLRDLPRQVVFEAKGEYPVVDDSKLPGWTYVYSEEDGDQMPENTVWIIDNLQGQWCSYYQSEYWFEDKNDAVLFKLSRGT